MELVSVKIDWNTRWHDINRGELLMCYQNVKNAGVRSPKELASANIAPSELRELIMHRHRVATASGAGTMQHVTMVKNADTNFVNGDANHWRPDRLIQFPLMQGKWFSNITSAHHGNIAAAFAEASAMQLWTRCAIAIKQYQRKFDSFPTNLSDLAKIGFLDYEHHSIGQYNYLPPMKQGEPATLEINTYHEYMSRSDEESIVKIQ